MNAAWLFFLKELFSLLFCSSFRCFMVCFQGNISLHVVFNTSVLLGKAARMQNCKVTSLGKGKATNLGNVFLLILAVYYDDCFHG
jgi:hypothetical protein